MNYNLSESLDRISNISKNIGYSFSTLSTEIDFLKSTIEEVYINMDLHHEKIFDMENKLFEISKLLDDKGFINLFKAINDPSKGD